MKDYPKMKRVSGLFFESEEKSPKLKSLGSYIFESIHELLHDRVSVFETTETSTCGIFLIEISKKQASTM